MTEQEERESRMFPEPGKNDVLSCHALTPDFLILGTDMGGVSYFFLEDWVTVQEFKHGVGIREIHPEPNGTKVILVDVKGQGHVYNPVNDEIALIREFPDKVGILSMLDRSVLTMSQCNLCRCSNSCGTSLPLTRTSSWRSTGATPSTRSS